MHSARRLLHARLLVVLHDIPNANVAASGVRGVNRRQPEVRPAHSAEPKDLAFVEAHGDFVAKRLQGCDVEVASFVDVCDVDTNVADRHGGLYSKDGSNEPMFLFGFYMEYVFPMTSHGFLRIQYVTK